LLKAIDAVRYILSKAGCLHPFRLSRILALADLKYLREKGKRLTDTVYRKAPGAFYIEGLKEEIQNNPCYIKHEGDKEKGIRSCIEYKCKPPEIPGELARYLNEAIQEAAGLDDMALNKKVVDDPLFDKLF
jgi:hydroxypyruvate isomerase